MAISGIEAFLELLAGCGVRHIFGNPGSTKLPLTEALVNHPTQSKSPLDAACQEGSTLTRFSIKNIHVCNTSAV